YVTGVYSTPVPPEPTRFIPGTVPTVLSTVMKFRRAPWYVIPYPVRTTVLSLPNHGTFHANPTAGPKLLESVPLRLGETLGLGEFFPTNCTCVRLLHVVSKPRVPGLDGHVNLKSALSSLPMIRASNPLS